MSTHLSEILMKCVLQSSRFASQGAGANFGGGPALGHGLRSYRLYANSEKAEKYLTLVAQKDYVIAISHCSVPLRFYKGASQ